MSRRCPFFHQEKASTTRTQKIKSRNQVAMRIYYYFYVIFSIVLWNDHSFSNLSWNYGIFLKLFKLVTVLLLAWNSIETLTKLWNTVFPLKTHESFHVCVFYFYFLFYQPSSLDQLWTDWNSPSIAIYMLKTWYCTCTVLRVVRTVLLQVFRSRASRISAMCVHNNI